MIGYGMLYVAAVGLPILLAAGVGASVARRRGSPERGFWIVALGVAMVLPLIVLASSSGTPQAVAPRAESGFIGLPSVVPVPVSLPSSPEGVARPWLGIDEVLIGLWIVASGVLALRWTVAARRLSRLRSEWKAVTLDGVDVWLAGDMGPAVSGLFMPRILVPAWLVTMPSRQRSFVLLHEREHLRAGDPWMLAVVRAARILTPWNPVVWLLSAKLLEAVELDCDRRVLRRHPDIEAYGTTLLAVSSRGARGLLGATAFADPEAPIRRRIIAMTTPPRRVSVAAVLAAFGLGIALVIGALEVPVPAITIQVTAEPSVTGRTSVRPEREDAPILPLGYPEPRLAIEAVLRSEAGTGAVRAIVRDGVNGQPMNHVQVFVGGTGLGGLTDEDGRVLLSGVPVGTQHVVALRMGYGEVTQRVTVVEGTAMALDFRLPETAVALEGVVVAGKEPARDRSRSGGSIVNEDEPRPVRSTISERPIFTPFTVSPGVRNEDEVLAAAVRAYPPQLRAEGIGGVAHVYLFIDEEGTVRDVRLATRTGHAALDEAALEVAGVYRFSPALNRDRPVAVWVVVPITFAGSRHS